jgi:hypothetical protein
MYFITTNTNPFINITDQQNNFEPKFTNKKFIPNFLKEIILNCWEKDIKKRKSVEVHLANYRIEIEKYKREVRIKNKNVIIEEEKKLEKEEDKEDIIKQTIEKRNYEIESFKLGYQINEGFSFKSLGNYLPIEKTCKEYLKNNLKNLNIENLKLIIEECENYLPKLKFRLKKKKIDHNFNDDELFTILIYTFDLKTETKKNFYYIFNEILRTRNIDEINPWKSYIYFFFKALEKLPNESLKIYRGVNDDEINKIYKDKDLMGEMVIWSGFTSCTKEKELAKKFAKKDGLIFKIYTKSGKFISPFSYFEKENEILILPNSKFSVIMTELKKEYFFVKLNQTDNEIKKIIVDKTEIKK